LGILLNESDTWRAQEAPASRQGLNIIIIDKRKVGYKRRKESVKKSTDVLFNFQDDVHPIQLCAQTLLFDS